jgi:hypothetical protein
VSREEIGDVLAEVEPRTAQDAVSTTADGSDGVVDTVDTLDAASASASASASFAGEEAAARRPPGHRTMIATLVVVTLLAGLAAWLGERAWGGTQDRDSSLDRPSAWAVVVDVRPLGGSGRKVAVDVVVRITNLIRTPVTVPGVEVSFDAGTIESIAPRGLTVAAGASADAVARATVDCGSPLSLGLYPLQVRRADRSLQSIEISGATAVLARICNAQVPDLRVLTLVGVSQDADRLRLVVRSPTGRTTTIRGLRARGVALTGRPLSGGFDGRERVLWVDRPRTCPAEWLSTGLPRTLTVEVDVGGPATVTLDVGYPLARWLRAAPCTGGTA